MKIISAFLVCFLNFLVTAIAAKHGLADIYDFVPEKYLNYHGSDFVNQKYTENVDTEPKVDKIKNELLSLLHNEYSNKALLAQISNPAKLNTTDKGLVKKVTDQDNEFKDNTRLAIEDWNRLKRQDDVIDEALSSKDIPKLSGNSNRLKRDNESNVTAKTLLADSKQIPKLGAHPNGFKSDIEGIVKEIAKSDQDLNVTEKITELVAKGKSILNKDITDKTTVEINANDTRPKRHTALKLLRDFFHHNDTAPAKKKSVVPLYLRQSPEIKENSTFTELIHNLTESIKILNKRMSNLQLHVNENVGFVLIKVPLSEIEAKKYLKALQEDRRGTKSRNEKFRLKRELAENSTEISNNSSLEYNTTQLNATKNDNSIMDAKEIVEPTIISDSETINELNELNKSKRDTKITDTDNYSPTNDSIVNTTEKSVELTSSKIFGKREGNPTEAKANETNNFKNESEPLNNSTKDTKLRDDTRKHFSKDLLFFIEKEYNEIKNLIAPTDVIRDKYSSTILYKIGYIIANLDTMEISLNKLKARVFNNVRDSKRLQHVYKKLNMTKKLVANVMSYLNKYADYIN